MKRIFLFILTNLLVMFTLSVLISVLGLNRWLSANGVDYVQLAGFCLVWGMGGALISLQLSRWMAKRAMGVQVIDPQTREPGEQSLLQMVSELAQAQGLPMPEVGWFPSDGINAFATGPSKSRSLVAVSAGLWQKMDREQARAVVGHELSHIANGDMVTMTLLQGIANAFVMFLARAIAFGLSAAGRRDENDGPSPMVFYLVVPLLEMIFMVFASIPVMWFSRQREFRADAGGARLAGRGAMIAALRGLQRDVEVMKARPVPANVRAMMISSTGGFTRLFMSHPPLEERIARLEQGVS